jgi:uncharacterized protein (DUF2147 family)
MRHLTAALLLLAPAPTLAADPIAGRWLTDTRDGIIQIGPCGAAQCGRLMKMLRPPKGPGTDRNNPDPKLRNRPLIGLPILTGFVADGDHWKGEAYDPKVGRSYSTTLERTGPETLKVKGCVAFFCRTVTWTLAR